MKIKLTSVFVDDQEKALQFYTNVLGFVKKTDVPAGQFRWLTVVSPESDCVEMLLEPSEKASTQAFKRDLYEQGIPFKAFAVSDIDAEYERLKGMGVKFLMEPTAMGPTRATILDDTCGNWIQIYEDGRE